MVRTRDKVRRIHTINMNWAKHELSECIHDVLMINHVSTEDLATTNTIAPSTTPCDI